MAKPSTKPESGEPRLEGWAAILANLLTLAVLGVAWYLEGADADLYYRSVQEDQALEWASFLGFFGAAVLFAIAAVRQWRTAGVAPWFLAGVGLFCFFVAMEEISWAQRVFAYRPPAYFLEHNFQQELNIHNVVDTDYRKLAVHVILLGYGVALPIVALYRPLRRFLGRWSIVAPPASLIPIFLVSYLVYESYPWDFTGEWVELTMAFGFLFAALPPFESWRAREPVAGPSRPRVQVAVWWLAVVLGGALLAVASERLRGSAPELVEMAQAEADALRLDLLGLDEPCQRKRHINKRVYSYVEKYGEDGLYHGSFAALVSRGMPEDRAAFFLDPWNSPYWVQCTRDGKRRFDYVYSFGPNRRRESTEWEILGDDVGAIFRERGEGSE